MQHTTPLYTIQHNTREHTTTHNNNKKPNATQHKYKISQLYDVPLNTVQLNSSQNNTTQHFTTQHNAKRNVIRQQKKSLNNTIQYNTKQ